MSTVSSDCLDRIKVGGNGLNKPDVLINKPDVFLILPEQIRHIAEQTRHLNLFSYFQDFFNYESTPKSRNYLFLQN